MEVHRGGAGSGGGDGVDVSGRKADVDGVGLDADVEADLIALHGAVAGSARSALDACDTERRNREKDGDSRPQLHARTSNGAGPDGQVVVGVPDGPLLTQASPDEFWARWPAINSSIDEQLRRQGVAAHDRDDIRHDVALAALDAWLGGRIVSSLEGWCAVVARNAAKRRGVRQSRNAPLESADALQARIPSVEDLVQSRLEADALGRVWVQLSPTEQSLLVASKPLSADPTARNRHYVALHRARKRARALMEAATLVWLGWSIALRRRGLPSVGQSVTSMAVASLAVVALVVADEHPVASQGRSGTTPVAEAAAVVTAPGGSAPSPVASTRSVSAQPIGTPRPRTPLRTPIEHREEVELPADRTLVAGIRNGDPEGEPLACAHLHTARVHRCVDVP